MRIGILTLPPHINYGGILQAYALQTVLERMGHKVEVFNNEITLSRIPLWKRPLSYTKRFIQRYVVGDKKVHILEEERYYKYSLIANQNTKKFVDKYLHQRIIHSFKEIAPNDYDAIIVGSDQIWRRAYFFAWQNAKDSDAYLGFTDGWDIIRIAYAASFGTDKIEVPNKNIPSCKKAIKKFRSISVREKSGVDVCRRVFDVTAVWMPDPTLLLSQEDYKKLFYYKVNEPNNKLLVSYILDSNEEKKELRDRIAKEKGLNLYIPNKSDESKYSNEFKAQESVEKWLSAFANASYVILDSFHGCVFSILFHKQFTVVANKERGIDRFTSLLEMFGLGDRLIDSPSEYHELPDIDYAKVDRLIKYRRDEAIRFLTENLK